MKELKSAFGTNEGMIFVPHNVMTYIFSLGEAVINLYDIDLPGKQEKLPLVVEKDCELLSPFSILPVSIELLAFDPFIESFTIDEVTNRLFSVVPPNEVNVELK